MMRRRVIFNAIYNNNLTKKYNNNFATKIERASEREIKMQPK
jgi:hypothetical protein